MSKRHGVVTLIVAGGLVIAIGGAFAAGGSSSDGVVENAKATHENHQHGEADGHLQASSANVSLVSKLEVKNVDNDKIADVGVWNDYAYLAAWGGALCKYNGVHVVDIRDATNPKEVAFIQSKEGSAPGEGIQALSIDTSSFSGDVLVTNNEKCKDKAGFGGLNLYDVSNPAHPTPLVEGFGDETVSGQGKKAANEIHSIFAWDAGSKAYAVIVDNEEEPDVDIVDISNPKKPSVIAEYDLDQKFPQILQTAPANLVDVFHHDVVVKLIDGKWVMLVSYWDGGYVKLDVTDPQNAIYLADSDFKNPDVELLAQSGGSMSEAPEGNAHEAEFTLDNRYIVAADEDFSPIGLEGSTNDGGSLAPISGSETPEIPVSSSIVGQTKYVGRACIGDTAVPAGDGVDDIAVVSRGLCEFTQKVANVEAATGYDAIIIVNREGADGCGPFGMTVAGGIPTVAIERSAGFGLFDVGGYNEAACRAGTAELIPGVAVGALGDIVTLTSFFDGWGYVHLYENGSGKLVELDTFAIPEAMNPAFAEGFGDLSVHEAATSPTRADLVYFSYYSGGLRVLKITADQKLQQVGHFIDRGGNNFWGVQVFRQGGKELVAASDMAHGLYIFEYTGSG